MATKKILLGALVACVVFPVLALVAASGAADQADRDVITAVIEKSYFHGAFNELNPDAMRAGFHQDFAIFSAKGEEMAKLPIAAWSESVGKRKADPAFDPAKNVWAGKIVSLDVTGGAAAAKIELSRDGKLIFTDYLSLLKFSNGWRIAAKVYTDHR